jgi:type II secretory pathway pseudopilin PulG
MADMGLRLLRRLRSDDGFGLVELLIAMLLLNIGLLALIAAMSTATISVRQASRVATASTLAETQIELYRALIYSAIALDTTSIPGTAPYTTDSAYNASQVTATCSGAVSSNPQCNASRSITGPDHGTYRVDTYIVCVSAGTHTVQTATTCTNGVINGSVRLVTVVVRDANNLTGPALARQSSSFDQSTGG